MKSSELREKLLAMEAEHGDYDVEFFCDPNVPGPYMCRPVHAIDYSVQMPARTVTFGLRHDEAWANQKIGAHDLELMRAHLEIPQSAPLEQEVIGTGPPWWNQPPGNTSFDRKFNKAVSVAFWSLLAICAVITIFEQLK